MSLAEIAQQSPLAAFCIGRTLPLEGGFVNDPADPGGATNHGVSLRFALAQVELHPDLVKKLDVDHDGHIDKDDIFGLTGDGAADIYFECVWGPGWYRLILPELLAWKCFDIAVNTGPKRSAIILQNALAKCGDYVFPDGAVGPATQRAVRAQFGADGGSRLLETVRSEQAIFYSRLVAKAPKLRRFLDGWMKRAAA